MTALALLGLGLVGGGLLIVVARYLPGGLLARPEDPDLVDDPDEEDLGVDAAEGST